MLRAVVFGLGLLVLIWFPPVAQAQIPDEFTNLRELPEDISKGELMTYMKGFSQALGVRCQHCHVGGDGKTLAGVDFASDEDSDKEMARFMMRLTQMLNGYALEQAPKRDAHAVTVECKTCHRGRAVPRLLRDELALAYEESGVEGAKARYLELRETGYGRGQLDFGVQVLHDFVETLFRSGKKDDAVVMARLNAEQNGSEAFAHVYLGLVLEQTGNASEARRAYRKALTIEPENRLAKARLSAKPRPKSKSKPK